MTFQDVSDEVAELFAEAQNQPGLSQLSALGLPAQKGNEGSDFDARLRIYYNRDAGCLPKAANNAADRFDNRQYMRRYRDAILRRRILAGERPLRRPAAHWERIAQELGVDLNTPTPGSP